MPILCTLRLIRRFQMLAFVVFVASSLLAAGCTADPAADRRATAHAPRPDGPGHGSDATGAAFAAFDARARSGAHLNVVFFGGSLTWGSNATDPNLTSYRGNMADRLRKRYPEAHFRFYDAAIGGTPSLLGVYRFDRDVAARDPDLVFLDFTANDGHQGSDPDKLAAYESLVRRTVDELGIPMVIAIFPFQWHLKPETLDPLPRVVAHKRIAAAYNVPVGDAIERVRQAIHVEHRYTAEELYPVHRDAAHPGDEGYALFADAVWDAFLAGVNHDVVCRAPDEMLHADTYLRPNRFRLAELESLPEGWTVEGPLRTSAFYDAYMARWVGTEAVAHNAPRFTRRAKGPFPAPEPLVLGIRAESILLFGTSTVDSGQYRIVLDGEVLEFGPHYNRTKVLDASARRFGGNTRLLQKVRSGLDPDVEHRLVIEPLFDEDKAQELRIESVCVAGGEATVRRIVPEDGGAAAPSE
ncbi:MAG: SGNH/GDSL hydrolase family protein [Planctomycetota bacterium]